jgi:post-segregation antitoxin (ccd killing protein)
MLGLVPLGHIWGTRDTFRDTECRQIRTAVTCVYNVRMARINVYVPDELADQARAAGLNISGMTQEALRGALAPGATDRWLERLEALPRADIPHDHVIGALDAAREDFGAH